jgi:CheY-like chemotaxis protein
MSLGDLQVPHRVALMGFASFEQQALDSYLKLARTRSPAYEPTASIDDAAFIVANGDRAGVVDVLMASERMGDAVLVGSHARQGAAAWLERPIDPLHLFRALDTAVRRRATAAKSAIPAPRRLSREEIYQGWLPQDPRRGDDTPFPELVGFVNTLPPSGGAPPTPIPPTVVPKAEASPSPRTYGLRRSDRSQASPAGVVARDDFAPTTPRPTPASEPRRPDPRADGSSALEAAKQPLEDTTGSAPLPSTTPARARLSAVAKTGGPATAHDALVVDGDDAGAASVVLALHTLGIGSLRVFDSRQTFAALREQLFDLIVIDVELGPTSDLDGLSLALALRRQPETPGQRRPPIVMTSSAATALEHARALLAGADAYLPKPVNDRALALALEELGLRAAAQGAQPQKSA